jgi:hypothetical protein
MTDSKHDTQNGKIRVCPRCNSEFTIPKGTRGRPRKFCRDKCTREFYEKDGKTESGPKRERKAPPANSGVWDGPTITGAVGDGAALAERAMLSGLPESDMPRAEGDVAPYARFDRFRPGSRSTVPELVDLFDGAVQFHDKDRDRARKRRERRRKREVMPEWDGWLEFDGGNPSEGSTSSRALPVIGSARPWNAN